MFGCIGKCADKVSLQRCLAQEDFEQLCAGSAHSWVMLLETTWKNLQDCRLNMYGDQLAAWTVMAQEVVKAYQAAYREYTSNALWSRPRDPNIDFANVL